MGAEKFSKILPEFWLVFLSHRVLSYQSRCRGVLAQVQFGNLTAWMSAANLDSNRYSSPDERGNPKNTLFSFYERRAHKQTNKLLTPVQ